MNDSEQDRKQWISAVIPAYNEARNIANVLQVIQGVPEIQETIVVSDGSTDNTAEIVGEFGWVRFIDLPANVGKTWAVLTGIAGAAHPSILLCDADLQNLSPEHLRLMITTYQLGFDMVIMDKGSQPWVFKTLLQSVPALSGTRILDREHFHHIPFRMTDRFQFEIRVNDYFLKQFLTIAIVPASDIYDLRKFVKYPFFKGLTLDIKGGVNALASDGAMSIVKNLRTFRKIKKYPQIS